MADKKPIIKKDNPSDIILWIALVIAFIIVGVLGLSGPLFNSNSSSIRIIFDKMIPIMNFFLDIHTWYVFGFISSAMSVFFIGIIIFSLVRMREIQLHEKAEIDHEINEALARDVQTGRNENPRWLYILTLVGSSNESDWRMAIIESDTMLDEVLKEKGYEGDTLADRLKTLSTNAFASIKDAWDAHNVRNQIAHSGIDFPLSQVETRRVIKMFQNVFEELRTI